MAAEADLPLSIAEIFRADPSTLSEAHFTEMVEYFRSERAKMKASELEGKKKPKAAKLTVEQAKTIDLDLPL